LLFRAPPLPQSAEVGLFKTFRQLSLMGFVRNYTGRRTVFHVFCIDASCTAAFRNLPVQELFRNGELYLAEVLAHNYHSFACIT
jgi:hypothetical protein